ncbi:hypothetical protein D9M71_510340 [compost metagenome]
MTSAPVVGSVKLPNTNHAMLLRMWCRPVTISRRLNRPKTNAPKLPLSIISVPKLLMPCWIGGQM